MVKYTRDYISIVALMAVSPAVIGHHPLVRLDATRHSTINADNVAEGSPKGCLYLGLAS
jgi:hypothetical protein